MVVCVNSQQYRIIRPMPLGVCATLYWNDLGLNKGDVWTRLIGHQTPSCDGFMILIHQVYATQWWVMSAGQTYHGYVIRWMHQSAVGTNGRDLWEGLGQLLTHWCCCWRVRRRGGLLRLVRWKCRSSHWGLRGGLWGEVHRWVEGDGVTQRSH